MFLGISTSSSLPGVFDRQQKWQMTLAIKETHCPHLVMQYDSFI